MFSILACSQGYLTAYELTATALQAQSGVGGSEDSLPPPGTAEPGGVEGTVDPANPSETEAPVQIQTEKAATEAALTTPLAPVMYTTQAGDTLPAIAARFDVSPGEIQSVEAIPLTGLIDAGKLLIIPSQLRETGPKNLIIPDSEVVFSPSALDFDISAFANQAGGYLSTYREYLANGWTSGAEVIYKVAIENSINPRLLVALLEFQSGWVYGQPATLASTDYPLGWVRTEKKGLYKQLSWAVQHLSIGYYGWRAGILTDVKFEDGSVARIAPHLNAGTVAVQMLFAQLYEPILWNGVLGGNESFSSLYNQMFGDSWLRANTVEPLLPVNLTQPEMILPFLPGHTWSFTGGPHSAWGPDGALAALDFAPSSLESGCVSSDEWVTAVTGGQVLRSENGVVILDSDGDGHEQTGWVILYLHIESRNRVAAGTWLAQGDLVGHPSCEGGVATGTHVHIARKYNGEWVLADGPLPFTMNGWRAVAGDKPYVGSLVKGAEIISSSLVGSYESRIFRPVGEN